jgi:mannosyltransferase
MSLRVRPYILGVVGFALMLWNLGVPSLWQDEAATIGAANRPIDSLWKLVQNIDAVHGHYYAFMHFWGTLFGFSPFALRVPSAFFVGLSAFLLFHLALRIRLSTNAATWAAVVFIALPRTHLAGSEARSNALTATLAIAVILVLVWALEGDRNWLRWLAFTGILTLSIFTFLFSALILVPIGIYLAVSHRQQFCKFGLATLGAMILAAPLIYFGYQERGQVGWIYAKPLTEYLWESLVAVDYNRAWPMAVIGLGLCVLAIVRKASLLVVLWATVPSALLIAVSLCFEPYFVDHYLTFTTGATAILIAVGLTKLPIRQLQWIVLATLVALSLPSFIQSREPMAKGTEWARVAEAVNDNSSPGDALLVPDATSKESRAIDLMIVAYEPEFKGRIDLTLKVKPAESNRLFGIRSKALNASEPASDRVLVLTDPALGEPSQSSLPTWLNDKFSVKQTLKFETTQITIFERIK